jgi:nucleoside-diphosphate-sugar epimerase
MVSPRASGKIYLVSDGPSVSTPDLVKAIENALGVRARLFPFPTALLDIGARITGKQEIARRLIGSLWIDCSKIRNDLHWEPPFTLAQGLERTAQWYHSQFHAKSGT